MDIKDDILFKIDMELYDEFNDTIATMNDHIGDIYSLRDVEEMEQAEKEKERKLLREAIRKLQKENQELKNIKNKTIEYIEENSFEDTTGVTLNLSDENYWKVLKLLKGDDVE